MDLNQQSANRSNVCEVDNDSTEQTESSNLIDESKSNESNVNNEDASERTNVNTNEDTSDVKNEDINEDKNEVKNEDKNEDKNDNTSKDLNKPNLPDLNKDIEATKETKLNEQSINECPNACSNLKNLTDLNQHSKESTDSNQSDSFKSAEQPPDRQPQKSLTSSDKHSQTEPDPKSTDNQVSFLSPENPSADADSRTSEDEHSQIEPHSKSADNQTSILSSKNASYDVVDSRTSEQFENKKVPERSNNRDDCFASNSRTDKQPHFNYAELSSKLRDLNLTHKSKEDQNENLPDLLVDSNRRKQDDKRFNDESDKEPPAYSIKWIKFHNKQCAIITQNENGCCPLLAIMNVLLLRGKINLPLSTKLITYDQMIVFLANLILENGTSNAPEQFKLDYEQNIMDAMQLFPKLQTGLDVNVQFNSITSFEYTSEMIIFDLLNISLYHGWIYDPGDLEMVSVVGNYSYNQLVDKIITNKGSNKEDEINQALIAESFLENTASQLTYFGLSELASNVVEGELSILFRNNHFITLYKNQNQLYQLVTDQGFLQEPDVVWMTLRHIDNDDVFVNHEFKPISPKSNTLSPTDPFEQKKQIDQDYLLALSMEEEEKKLAAANQAALIEYEYDEANTLNDEMIARKLQAEEERVKEMEDKALLSTSRKRPFRSDRSDWYAGYAHSQRQPQVQPEQEEAQQQQQQQFINQYDPHYEQQFNQQFNQPESNQPISQLLQPEQTNREQHRSNRRETSLNTHSSENHTQSSSSRDRNSNHHNSHHGHKKSNNCIIS